MKLINCFVAAGMLGSLSAFNCAKADDSTTANKDNEQIAYPLYRPQELDLDVFGSGSIGQQTIDHLTGSRIRHNGLGGGGGGATFFFLRYLGVGADFDAEGRTHEFFDSASGNVYLRVPICNTGLAPYIFGGGGYQFQDVRQSFGQAGGGLEFRFCKHVGIFVDARYVIAERTENYGLGRAGLRVTF